MDSYLFVIAKYSLLADEHVYVYPFIRQEIQVLKEGIIITYFVTIKREL